jgi:hypothetical protein
MLRAARSVIPVFCCAMFVCGGLLVSCGRDSHSLPDLGVSPQSQSVDTTNSLPPVVSAPPTTSGTPVLSGEDHARSDFLVAMAAREKCDYKPSACDFAAVSVQGSEMDLVTRETMTMYTDNNLRAAAGRGDVFIRVESVSVFGSENVMYGSDYPHTIGDLPGCLKRVNGLPDGTRDKVRGHNAQRIFGF